MVFWENGQGEFFPKEFIKRPSESYFLFFKKGTASSHGALYHVFCYDEITNETIDVPYRRFKLYDHDINLSPDVVKAISQNYFLDSIIGS